MRFLDTLFYPGEHTSFSSNVKATNVRSIDTNPKSSNFLCINPLDPANNSRADSNVTAYRNFLVEIDQGTVVEQGKVVHDAGLPYSTAVFSGNKSIHFIVCLKESLADKDEYKAYAKAIVAKIAGADKAVTNPARLSRFPGVTRSDTGKIQTEIINKGKKITKAVLDEWLGPIHSIASQVDSEDDGWTEVNSIIYPTTNSFLLHGAPDGEFNNGLIKCAFNLRDAGFSYLAARSILEGMTLRVFKKPLDAKDLATLANAFNSRI